ncbi:MAG TPA: PilW family protein [Gammaproteobacteria bacterium]|nr:PilW family protein [Gammaproteobacteria bacterium]
MSYQLKRQAGLTLVELMVATTLSLVLLAGVLLVFTANKTTYQMQNGLGTLQENGRYAMRQITADLQLAGFGGCLSPRLDPRVVILANTPPPYLTNFTTGEFFDGRNDETATHTYGGKAMYQGPDYDADGTIGDNGTDSIEIRGPLRSDVRFVTGEILTTGTVDVIGTGSGFATDEYLMIADCAGADIFRATGVTESGGDTQIAHAASSNSQAGLSRRYGADSVVMEFATHTYFIADTGRVNSYNQPVTALYRFDGTNSQELVDGVEDLQVQFALDTDGNGVVDDYQDPGGVTDWSEVMAVRVSLLLNSVEGASATEAPFTFFPNGTGPVTPASGDLRLRQEFTALVSVRNSVL